jgi:hypothetical protein
VVRKMALSHMTGVLLPQGGNSHFQAMFEVSLHASGRPVARLTPFWSAPRHCGQLIKAESRASAASPMALARIVINQQGNAQDHRDMGLPRFA